MKVALFGGSFNPVHNGHLEIANELLTEQVVDQVWFVPCGNHAFGKELAPAEDRLNMLNLATKRNPKLKVIDLEIKSREKSFSAKTIKSLRRKFNYNFYFVIGADNLRDLKKWYDFEYLREKVQFILIKRPKYVLPRQIEIKVLKIISLGLIESSTEIRSLVKKNKDFLKFVPRVVAEYIENGGLYK
jgi:nicotinate-nucleotide adenylyltransferase